MFGLPYIIAPMEAESQCAWLDEAGLVDGVVTDDNDVFLFGGQRVYRCVPWWVGNGVEWREVIGFGVVSKDRDMSQD